MDKVYRILGVFPPSNIVYKKKESAFNDMQLIAELNGFKLLNRSLENETLFCYNTDGSLGMTLTLQEFELVN